GGRAGGGHACGRRAPGGRAARPRPERPFGQRPRLRRGEVTGQDQSGVGRREGPVVGQAEVVNGGRPKAVLRAGDPVGVGVAGAGERPRASRWVVPPSRVPVARSVSPGRSGGSPALPSRDTSEADTSGSRCDSTSHTASPLPSVKRCTDGRGIVGAGPGVGTV